MLLPPDFCCRLSLGAGELEDAFAVGATMEGGRALLRPVATSATWSWRHCSEVVVGATKGGLRATIDGHWCYIKMAGLLQRLFGGAIKGGRRCYEGCSPVLPMADGVAVKLVTCHYQGLLRRLSVEVTKDDQRCCECFPPVLQMVGGAIGHQCYLKAAGAAAAKVCCRCYQGRATRL